MTDPTGVDQAPCGLASVLKERGFEHLMPIQEAVLSTDIIGRDLRISSQTGSGKTVAIGFAVAPLVKAAAEARTTQKGSSTAEPAVLVVAPTRELAGQLARELTWLFKPLRARVVLVTGGTSTRDECFALRGRPEVVVGTPGRLVDHLGRKTLSLGSLATLVLDEADELLAMGFEEEIDAIFAATPEGRQTHLLSATFPAAVRALANRLQRDPLQLRGSPEGQANTDIEHLAILVRREQLLDATINLLLQHPDDKTLLFVKTRADSAELASALSEAGFSARALNGDMSHRERTTTFHDFRTGSVRFLVATDVAARGLDVDDVRRVIQVDPPHDAEVLTHRSGRTGRAGVAGTNVLLIPPRAQQRVGVMLSRAGITARLTPVPTAREIREAAETRLCESLRTAGGEDDARLRELAERLLQEHDASSLIARLLARAEQAGPCAPRDVRPVAPSRSDRAQSNREREPRSQREGHARPERGPALGRGRRREGTEPGFITYQVSWGTFHGADPGRLLALVCRRGGITKAEVGAIRLLPKSSAVDVAERVALDFDKAVAQPDARDPLVRFRRFPEATPPHKRKRRPDLAATG